MTFPSPDRPEPGEQQPLRARVPDHVVRGAFSTGVIVMTANTEFVLDFVQNLGRPHQIVARVVMPHHVLPQLVDALNRNIELYRGRWGELPTTGQATGVQAPPSNDAQGLSSDVIDVHGGAAPGDAASSGVAAGSAASGGQEAAASGGQESPDRPAEDARTGVRQASAQEIYDDLKIRDELLSGAYANAVMIGHGPHEFSFDFITNFYPNSAVSARVFLAAGQVPRLFQSLKGTWEQMRSHRKPPGQNRGGGSDPMPPESGGSQDYDWPGPDSSDM